MRKVVAALALALASSAANAANYSFDLRDRVTGSFAGTGTFSFSDHTTAEATTIAAGRATYRHMLFDMTLSPTNLPSVHWTTGMVTVAYNVVPPFGGPTSDGITFVADNGAMFAYGDGSFVGSGDTISNGNFNRQNFNNILATMPSASVTIGGPPTYRFTAFNFEEVIEPVPEPGEWAMLIAGLGVVGMVASRRKNLAV